MTRITVNIERLVIDGIRLDQRQSGLVQAAIDSRLTDLVTNSGLAGSFNTSGAVPQLMGGSVAWDQASGVSNLGELVGDAIFRTINK